MADNALFEPTAGTPAAWPDNRLLAAPPSMADAYDYHAQALQKWMAEQRAGWAETERAEMADGRRDPTTGELTPAGMGQAAFQAAMGLSSGGLSTKAVGPGLPGAATKVLQETMPGFRAYHGSPHSFDAFDSAKIGTGEGAQAYGHGLYLADREGVARSYRDSLSPTGVVVMRGGEPVGPLPNAHIVNDPQFVAAYNGLMPDPGVPGWIKSGIIRDIHRLGETGQAVDLGAARQASIARMTKEMADFGPANQERALAHVNRAYDSIGGDVQFRRPGHMYEVQVNADPAHFLDWDKPLSEQSPHVQQALTGGKMAAVRPVDGGYVVDYNSGGQQKTSRVFSTAEAAQNAAGPLTAAVRDWASGHAGAKGGDYRVSAEQSKALREAGIPGIRYLDGGSRADGTGTSNHVIFDPDTIAILRKYGIAGLIAGGGAAAAGKERQ